ncbi:MAG: serine--tRNA ligase, partial [Cytophagaceae bacterium]
MLLISEIKENPEAIIQGLNKKNFKGGDEVVRQVIEIDTQRRETQQELDATLADSNAISKEIGQLMKQGKKEEAEKAKAQTSGLKDKAKELGDRLNTIEQDLQDLLVKLPNLPHSSVPAGKSAEDNEIVYQVDTLPQLSADALPHWDLIKKYDI